ncbi:molybdate transport system regulatory protein [Cricetibacter osteomyelitidis]|uniref:Molybdate transport system regulatory protein n=1 Tax=Cricetibacter osteomyelitidis TaxID=1521931 RepID=A0A4R2T7T0_9PAST|nr:TOBE domain-containing protein [Cricetibacter osteomyelitidis]TCP97751.1 molybdate transport system regulatory protein [Cricetibacter osteomyelitidis]
MTISARNQLAATVTSITPGAVNDLINIQLATGEPLAVVITTGSTQVLGLTEGKNVVAIFKAPSVILSTDNSLLLSARNQLAAKVVEIKEGVVNAEVTVKTNGGAEIVAIITETSLKKLGISVGYDVNVIIKASQVILGVKK